jgi:hypothetical protein
MNIRNALVSYKLLNVVKNHTSAQMFLMLSWIFLSLSNVNGADVQFLLIGGPKKYSAKLVYVGSGGITLKLVIN